LSAAEGAAGPPPGQPSEEELRAAYEAELARITTTDMIAQVSISILNLGARKLAPGEGAPAGQGAPEGAGRDLEQVRDAIDAVRALLEILERRIPQELPPLRDALSRLQMAYAQEIQRAPAGKGPSQQGGPAGAQGEGGADQGGGSTEGGGPGPGGASGEQPPQGQEPHRPGPAESSGRLWVPGK